MMLQREALSSHWEHAVSTTTDANGAYTFARSESVQGDRRFQPTFAGAGTYAEAIVVISITVCPLT
jgi:hypothetical protein